MSVILETSVGDITLDLYIEERPSCCLNFLKLCKIKYYNFHLFHSVQPNFIAQTGDPTGTGRGGECVFSIINGNQAKYFEAELKPRIKHSKKGSISMANDGNNRHGSQFFITLSENNDYLDKQNHTVFGEVAEGFNILEKVNTAIIDENNRPLKDIRIYHTVVLDDPFPDPSGLEEFIPVESPMANTQEQLEPRIGADEDTDDERDLEPEEIEERKQERDAKTNAQILELLGDIPDVDVKPPDNVLFVCKLNPVTNDEDLEIIFSRFGPILNCEVIRNKKTNESLQYAFIEFEKAEDCEKAYFKMDNVLIDDRRIHVDFSQSVSKLKWDRPNKGEDEQKPQYRIKDFEKKNDGYEFVFEEPKSERYVEKNGKSHKHEKKQKRKSPHLGEGQPLTKRGRQRNNPEDEPSYEAGRRYHSPPQESRKKNRSPSAEHRSKHHKAPEERRKRSPPVESRHHRSPLRDERRRHRSPPKDQRHSRHHDNNKGAHRNRSVERGHRRRSSSSREDSRRRHQDGREKEHRSRR